MRKLINYTNAYTISVYMGIILLKTLNFFDENIVESKQTNTAQEEEENIIKYALIYFRKEHRVCQYVE